MNNYLLAFILALPVAASAQKLVASHEPVIYQVRSEKAPLYRAAADTASKTGFFLPAGEDASVVGEFSPRWLVVKRQGFLYLTPTAMISAPVRSLSTAKPNHKSAARTEEYCMILATQKLLSTKVTISIDFGQERRFFADNLYRDAEGKVQAFNSVIDVLNYQNSQGREFVNAYSITTGGQNVYHYVMRRKITE